MPETKRDALAEIYALSEQWVVARANIWPPLDREQLDSLARLIAGQQGIRVIEVVPALEEKPLVLFWGGQKENLLSSVQTLIHRLATGSEQGGEGRFALRLSPLRHGKLPRLSEELAEMVSPLGEVQQEDEYHVRLEVHPPARAASPPSGAARLVGQISLTPYPVLFAMVLATQDVKMLEILLSALTHYDAPLAYPVDTLAIRSLRKEFHKTHQTLAHMRTFLDDITLRNSLRIICRIPDYTRLPLGTVYRELSNVFRQFTLRVTGSQILGYVPLEAFFRSATLLLGKGTMQKLSYSDVLEKVIARLRLEGVEKFRRERQILDLLLAEKLRHANLQKTSDLS